MKKKSDGIYRLDDIQWPPIVIETTTTLQEVRNLLDTSEARLCQVTARPRIRRGSPWMDIRPPDVENAKQILRDALEILLNAAKRGELKEFRVIHGFGYLPPEEVGPWTGLFS